ncbi:MAG: long-chain fatty acid--CoA ligase [Pseudomonadota bacterium]
MRYDKSLSSLKELIRGRPWRRAPIEREPWLKSYPEGIDWHVSIEPRPLFSLLDQSAAAYPDHPCLEFLGKRQTYGEVAQLVERTAKGLQDLGVTKGTRVGLLLPNSPYYVICYHAILKVGGIVVNFNPLYAEREIARQVEDSGTKILVTIDLSTLYRKVVPLIEGGQLERLVVCRMSAALRFPEKALFTILRRREVTSIPSDEQHVKFDKLIDNDGAIEPVQIDPAGDVAVLQYTGGTTGEPMAAELTHANLYTNVVQTRSWARSIEPGTERVLAVLPLCHVFGMTAVMNLALSIAAELILLPRFKVAEVLKAIDKRKPTVFMGVPTMYSAINAQKDLEKLDLSSLNYCLSGGSALSMSVKETFETLTGCVLVEGYGLTEAGPVVTINPFTGSYRADSIGLPIPGTSVRIMSLKAPDREMPAGERGEICVAGPQVMARYRDRAEASANAIKDGLLHTGDVGYMDDDGYVYLIDRIKDLIITGGFNVYPRMVEEAVSLHPAIEAVAVCGVPDKHRGEVVKAYVQLRAGKELSGGELRAFLRDKLATFEIPRRIEFRDRLPLTIIGKPSRHQLIAEEQKQQAAPAEA